jgi:hypothetical protein
MHEILDRLHQSLVEKINESTENTQVYVSQILEYYFKGIVKSNKSIPNMLLHLVEKANGNTAIKEPFDLPIPAGGIKN